MLVPKVSESFLDTAKPLWTLGLEPHPQAPLAPFRSGAVAIEGSTGWLVSLAIRAMHLRDLALLKTG
jgi:hypothetical protein